MSDILSSISIILLFVPVSFDLISKKVSDFLVKDAVDKKDRKTEFGEIKKEKNELLLYTFCISIVYLLLTYLFLPKTFEIMTVSKLSLWNFDIVNTFYIVIHVGVASFTIASVIKFVQVVKKKIGK